MKIICVGQNYLKHIEELKSKRNSSPILFLKPDSSVIQKNQPFFIPEFSDEIHYEVELILKFNKLGKHINSNYSKNYYNLILQQGIYKKNLKSLVIHGKKLKLLIILH
jgi:2-keto-4-pentenoate hydratase/2-oxohepta-3-ene-1,7-dioic acid hydratase in catechol pathway